MKKTITLIACLLFSLAFVSSRVLALDSRARVEIGCSVGLRTITNADIKEVYGNGVNYFPNIALVWNGIMVGFGYEGGYKRNGLIGIYQESATLTVRGPEFFLGYQLNLNKFAPFFKVGFGYYSYKQVVDSDYLADYPVDGTKKGLTFGGGFKFYLIRKLFISAEVKYGHLKVKPYDTEVDLGGMRVNGGLGVRF